jgi:DNA-binding response OmpR family regulator
MKWNLVYFDDQIQNIEAFKEVLSDKFNVIGCSDATAFPQILEQNNPHAILLDVHMPVIDGHALFKKISQHPLYNGCPVIFISGDASDENKIKSYVGGAIDFLPRDLKIEEIAIRLENKVKFHLQMSTILELGNLQVDVKAMKASVDGKSLDLTLLELRMLSHLLRSYPQTLSRMELITRVWGNDTVKPGTINTHLTNLKPKIEGWDYQIKVREDNILIQKKEKS